MKIKIAALEKLIIDALLTEYSSDEAALIKEVMLFGELAGKPSHGIIRLLKENYGVFVNGERHKPEFVKKTKVSTIINARGNPGMLIGPLAMYEVIHLAKENGIGIVGTKGSVNTTGSLTYYCEKIAKENLIAFIFTHSSPMMAPFFSVKALFGTNPLAFGIPANPQPIIFDMSTSAITFGAVIKHKAEGKQIPPNVAIDSEGNMTTDPAKAIEGAMLAFDNSYKGSGLAMMVEILAAVWTGASFAGNNNHDGWGNLYMAFSPELLSDTETFKQKAQQLVETLRHVKTRDGKPTRIPGENTLRIRDENLKRGEIEVDEKVIERVKRYLKNYKL